MTHSPHPDLVLPGVCSPRSAARFTTHVPVYDLTASAGFWGLESQPGLFTALEDGKFLVDLGNHLAHARLRESLLVDGTIALEVCDPLLEDPVVAMGLLGFASRSAAKLQCGHFVAGAGGA